MSIEYYMKGKLKCNIYVCVLYVYCYICVCVCVLGIENKYKVCRNSSVCMLASSMFLSSYSDSSLGSAHRHFFEAIGLVPKALPVCLRTVMKARGTISCSLTGNMQVKKLHVIENHWGYWCCRN